MDKNKFYELPMLNYGYKDLEPFISEEQLKIHYEKHHKAYVDAANDLLNKIDDARRTGKDFEIKSTLKSLSWNIGGHILHSLFWENLAPKGGKEPIGKIADEINKEFGSFENFKKEFSNAAKSVEGSGWAALVNCTKTSRPLIMQIEKHNANIYPGFAVLLVLDVFEHAYYIDYKNDRGKFVDAFWNIVNWDAVNERCEITK